jgi:hypothetical protein
VISFQGNAGLDIIKFFQDHNEKSGDTQACSEITSYDFLISLSESSQHVAEAVKCARK